MKKEVRRFEDLQVWKDAMNLTLSVYEKMRLCKDLGMKDQIQRAAVSIPSNIAEGFERQTTKEFVQFLYIAKGSCAELRTQLYLSIKLNYLLKTEGMEMVQQAENISKMLYNLILYRKSM
ncbi:MAG: four helix bundle protein [Dysgonamonadaceae bacterium]|jgi:four helix bundle protein|nr:four helix bundle protein [Dysgonamonadaceae bacterium]